MLASSAPRRLLALILVAAAAVVSPRLAAQEASAWRTSTPEAQGVDGSRIDAMVARIGREGMQVHSFVLVKNGYLVSEHYFGSYARNTRHTMYSVSKSFTSAAFGIALEQGLIGSLDQRLLDIYSDRTVRNPTAAKRSVTLRHLLTMSSGHEHDTFNLLGSSTDWVQTFLDADLNYEPGTRFGYDSGATMMLSAVLQRKTGMNLLAFADRHLFGPLGITNYAWPAGPGNITPGGWGLMLTPLDMAKFGMLYLRNGQWQGRQIVPASWVAESSRQQIANGSGGAWGSGYGYQFWLNEFGGYRADGYGGQFIFILPEDDAVAVFTAGYSNGEPPMRLMSDYVVPALRAEELLPGVSTAPSAPVIHLAPAGLTLVPGTEAVFQVRASGGQLSYQWLRDGVPLAGATSAVLRIPAANASHEGGYSVRITNARGAIESTPALLRVAGEDTGSRIVNLSARARVAPGSETLIIGFIVAGDSPAAGVPLLLRAVGPTLADHQVTGPLEDPTAVLYAGDRAISVNQNWRGDALVADTANGIHAFPFPVDSRDAALHAVLPPRAYTLHVASTDGTGVALGECYQAKAHSADGAPRLINLSARAAVSPGEGTLIAGFIISGEGRREVLIRAIGPTLAKYDVTGYLSDPVLTLHSAGGAVIASNDDWRGDPALKSAFERMGAPALPDTAPEAVLLVSLPPGSYTAHVSGKNDARGIALVELYSP